MANDLIRTDAPRLPAKAPIPFKLGSLAISDALRREVLATCSRYELEDEINRRGWIRQDWRKSLQSLAYAFFFIGTPILLYTAERCTSSDSLACKLLGF